jgi:hypothetical protein
VRPSLAAGLALACAGLVAGAVAARDLPEGTDLSVYSGDAGWKVVPGTTRLVADRVAAGEVVAEQSVAYLRTGVLRETVRYAAGAEVAKGTPVYAVWLREAGTGWCAPGVLGPSGAVVSAKRKPENCFFRDPDDSTPFYTKSHKGKSAFHAPMTTGRYFVKSPVLVDETEGGFDHPMKLTLRLAQAKGTQLAYEVVFTDSFGASRIFEDKAEPGSDGTWAITLWGGRLAVRREGGGFAVTEASPLRDELGADERLRGSRTITSGIYMIWF